MLPTLFSSSKCGSLPPVLTLTISHMQNLHQINQSSLGRTRGTLTNRFHATFITKSKHHVCSSHHLHTFHSDHLDMKGYLYLFKLSCFQANSTNSPCLGIAGPMGLRSMSSCHVFTLCIGSCPIYLLGSFIVMARLLSRSPWPWPLVTGSSISIKVFMSFNMIHDPWLIDITST